MILQQATFNIEGIIVVRVEQSRTEQNSLYCHWTQPMKLKAILIGSINKKLLMKAVE